jgi:hypothetical protein
MTGCPSAGDRGVIERTVRVAEGWELGEAERTFGAGRGGAAGGGVVGLVEIGFGVGVGDGVGVGAGVGDGVGVGAGVGDGVGVGVGVGVGAGVGDVTTNFSELFVVPVTQDVPTGVPG